MTLSERGPAVQVIDRGLARLVLITGVGGLLVGALWFLIAPPETPGNPQWLLAAAVPLLGALVLTIAQLVPRRQSPQADVRAILAVTLLVLFALVAWKATSGLLGWWPQIDVIATTALIAAAALSSRAASIGTAILITALAAATPLLHAQTGLLHATPVELLFRESRLVIIYLTVLAFATLLRRSARLTDAEASESDRLARLEADLESERLANSSMRAVLHDTLLNTLAAISHHVPDSLLPELRQRCAGDIQRWEAMSGAQRSGGPPAGGQQPRPDEHGLLRNVPDRMRYTGMNVRMSVSGDEADIPRDVRATVADTVEELVQNVSKHAGVNEATVSGRIVPGHLDISVTDLGAGFRPGSTTPSIGLSDSVATRCDQIGADLRINSHPGVGTRVRIVWPADPDPGADQSRFNLAEPVRRAAFWIVLATSAVSVLGQLTGWFGFSDPMLALIMVLATTAALISLLQVDRVRGLGPPEAAMSLMLATALILLTPLSDSYCSTWLGSSALPDNRLLLFLVPAVLMGSRGFTLVAGAVNLGASLIAAVAWIQLWPGCSPDFMMSALAGTVLILGAGQLGEVLARQSAVAESSARIRLRNEIVRDRLAAQQAVSAAWAFPAVDDALTLLRQIANTTDRPIDEQTRRTARYLATSIRIRIACTGGQGPLAGSLRRLVDLALAEAVPVQLAGDPELIAASDPDMTAAAEEMRRWAAGLPLSEARQVSIRISRTGDLYAILVRVTPGITSSQSTAPEPGTGPVLVSAWADEDGHWWRAQWQARPAEQPVAVPS